MIMDISHMLADCPICGQLVQIQLRHVGRELACRHCRGRFVVLEPADGQRLGLSGLLRRSDRHRRNANVASRFTQAGGRTKDTDEP